MLAFSWRFLPSQKYFPSIHAGCSPVFYGLSPAPGTTEFAISLCGEAARVVLDRGSEGQLRPWWAGAYGCGSVAI